MAKHEILLIGDGSHLFRTIGWVLEYKGYTVRIAASPEAALEALVKKNYDLVIARITLEALDGLDILKRAKKLNPEVKVIILSGNHEVTLPMEAYQIEVDDYILMPVSPIELWRRVSHCLEILDLKPVSGLGTQPQTADGKLLNRLLLMFHDIRGSMVSTAASLKLLGRGTYGDLGPEAKAKVHEVSKRVENLIQLTEEWMGKAWEQVSDGEIKQEILDLKQDIVQPVLAELAPEFQEYDINLDNRLESHLEEMIAVKGSRLWLKSVFRNLINNGIKHGGRGCSIVIDCERRGLHCRLNVQNSGKAIPEEYRSLLFSNQRMKTRRARSHNRDLGIGLYLSRDVVHSHGGDIWFEPKTDGSNFVVSLPQN
jgi:signal transduction histidine kinase